MNDTRKYNKAWFSGFCNTIFSTNETSLEQLGMIKLIRFSTGGKKSWEMGMKVLKKDIIEIAPQIVFLPS